MEYIYIYIYKWRIYVCLGCCIAYKLGITCFYHITCSMLVPAHYSGLLFFIVGGFKEVGACPRLANMDLNRKVEPGPR